MSSAYSQSVRHTFGFDPVSCPPDTVINLHHKDVLGMWFVAPVTGIIDTIFWIMGDTVGAKDSTVYLRPHNSRITPTYGPGANYPFPPMPWGYFLNTNDQDRGVAASPDDATPIGLSSWTSASPTGPPTQPPWTESLWAFDGFGISLHGGNVNAIALLDGGDNLDIKAGQNFFLSFRIKGPDTHVDDLPTQFLASHTNIPSPSHNWTFFEHDSVLNPGAVKGWWAVGGPNFNIWYSMVVAPTMVKVPLRKGWNLLSLTVDVASDLVVDNYPTAASGAFRYSSGKYTNGNTMQHGPGYWIKFPDSITHSSTGIPSWSDTADVFPGWNIIGSPGISIPTSWISSALPGIITSNIWGYDSAYHITANLVPGHGYWVKVNQTGKLILSTSGPSASPLNQMAYDPGTDWPPPPPDREIPNLKSIIPDRLGLSQNYPNPFNPTTTISYTLPEDQHVRIVVYNLLGQEVATLVDGFESGGYKSVRFDARGLTSGIYYYRMKAAEFQEVRKMVVAK